MNPYISAPQNLLYFSLFSPVFFVFIPQYPDFLWYVYTSYIPNIVSQSAVTSTIYIVSYNVFSIVRNNSVIYFDCQTYWLSNYFDI